MAGESLLVSEEKQRVTYLDVGTELCSTTTLLDELDVLDKFEVKSDHQLDCVNYILTTPHSHTSSVALPEVFKVHSLKMDQIVESTEDIYYAMSEARPGVFNLGEAFAFSTNLAYFNTVRLLC